MTLRRWQAECLPIALRHVEARQPPALIRAVTGAGKSILIREICDAVDGRIVVTTPTVALVDQLATTLSAGRYYTHAHDTHTRVTVVCDASAEAYAEQLGDDRPRLWIADEAHRSEAARIRAAYDLLRPDSAIGLTATPYRSDKRERLTLWQSLIYDYGPADAIRDAVVVPIELHHPEWDGGERGLDDVSDDCVRAAIRVGPTVVSAVSIDDAERYAERLSAQGIPALAIHSRQPGTERADALRALESGRIRVIVHVALLTEGVDLPWLQCLVLRRPSASRLRLVQEIGRVLRTAPGKSVAHVWDPHDLLGTLRLDYEAVLGGESEAPRTAGDEVRDATDRGQSPPPRYVAVTPIGELASVVRQWAIQAQQRGEQLRIASSRWRHQSPTDRQLGALDRMRWAAGVGGPGAGERALLLRVIEAAPDLDRGTASDLLSVLRGLADTRRWDTIRLFAETS